MLCSFASMRLVLVLTFLLDCFCFCVLRCFAVLGVFISAVLAYHFFHMLWNMQFLYYLCYMVIAGSCVDWYFTRYDADGNKKRGSGPNVIYYNQFFVCIFVFDFSRFLFVGASAFVYVQLHANV